MVSAVLGIKPGQTDSRSQFHSQEVHCLGCLRAGPVVKVDEHILRRPILNQLKEIFAEAKQPAAKVPVRQRLFSEKEQVSHAKSQRPMDLVECASGCFAAREPRPAACTVLRHRCIATKSGALAHALVTENRKAGPLPSR